jgi:hypothetical protein
MEKRRSQRIVAAFNAELTLNENNYTGVVENISKEGIYMRTLPAKVPTDFTPGTKLELKVTPRSEETLILHCEIIWSIHTSTDGLTSGIGMEIIDPPSEYDDLLKKQEYIDLYIDEN